LTERRLLLDLTARSRNWALPADAAARLLREAPAGWEVQFVSAPTSSDGDGSAGGSDEAIRKIRDAEVYFGFGFSHELMVAAERLRWVHSAAAGVGNVLKTGIEETDILITNSAGTHGPPIAEFVVAGILHFLRGLDVAIAQQRRKEWSKEFFVAEDTPLREISECRVLIVGTGGLGGESAKRLTCLGATCVGVRRRLELGAPEGFAAVVGPEGLDGELGSADVLVLAAPFTSDTSGMMTRERLMRLPQGAIVVNVARGALLDDDALIDLLERGRLRGAVLDVFREEPLPATSRLWSLPNALITPHTSPVSPRRFWPRQLDLFLTNWHRYERGEPLLNLVDKHAGY
jgi:phosphoglycerate dehydrogenase-like enzyme